MDWARLLAYILVGFTCLFFPRYGEEEKQEPPIEETNLVQGYRFAGMHVVHITSMGLKHTPKLTAMAGYASSGL